MERNDARRAFSALVVSALWILTSGSAEAQADEVQSIDFCPGNKDCLDWSLTTGAQRHLVYRGVPSALPALLDNQPDACRLSTHDVPVAGRWLLEAPLTGDQFWYLATAENAGGEGPAGDHSAGPRSLDPTGDCGFECNPDYAPRPHVGLTEAPGVGGCPDGMVPVDTFCIDRYEASLVRVPGGEPWSPFVNPAGTRVRAVSLAGAFPQAYINQIDAGDACEEAGKRLCTNAEWLAACRGPLNSTYPYGDIYQAEACNDTRAVHPAIEYFGTTEPWIWSMLDHPCLNQLPDGMETSGSRAQCETAGSVFDMMGNLTEWTSDPSGTLRGGSFLESSINGAGCLWVATAHNTNHFDFLTGFRCCWDGI